MITIVIILIFILVSINFITKYLKKLKQNKDFYQNIRGPRGLPILGSALDFKTTKDVLQNLINYTRDYGEVVTAQIGPFHRYILVSNYDFLECVLSSTKLSSKSHNYNFLRPWLGTGLLTSDGAKWKTHRRILTPAFHFQILEQFIEVFEKCGNTLLEKLRNEVDKETCDIYPYVTMCTLDIICESIMGISINAQEDSTSDYVQSVKNVCRIMVERSISPLQMCPFMYPLTKNYWTEKKSLKILHKQTNDVINARRKELESSKEVSSYEENFTKKKKPFLDLLLETKIDNRLLTQEEIREEVDTFMFEGHDTTASAVSFTLFCLANNLESQQKAFEEQQAIFGNIQNVTASYTDLQNMKYLEQVIKEALRLYPSVPFYGREITENVEYDGKLLPKGDILLIFAFGIHRNEKYFPNPEKFDPDRFHNMDNKTPYAYIPFSAGPRNCIGQKFAMLEMKSTVSKVLRQYKLLPTTPQHELELVGETILKSTNGIKIRVTLRN
ncbi:cytochrome P450 4c3 isoform X2 [Tribolium castaneum]|uniref:Cytochrome P450-like protein n=1 Tax=Tribolium castaneum TaxID=7070 RepID=D6WYC3_TRICA|nr:PREDICTED: cytochrome P450 4c3 [Tribolium castaneum]EFA09279.1 cytochrome P450-like protein [Tribolium castaneum]|eukprot:XP_008199996.1 PREDICTED: cytochrome P450 4c3 [Tribolium castaneum]